MMPTPSGRAYSPPGYARELQALRDEVAQLRRRVDRQPKIPPPVVAGGGGIVGQAEIYCIPGTVGSGAGSTSMDYWNVRWDEPYDPSGLSKPTWVHLNEHQVILDPGSYIATLSTLLTWPSKDTAPERFDVVMGGGDDIAHINFAQYPPLRIGNAGESWGLNILYNPGPFYAKRPIQVEVQYGGDAGPMERGSLILLITKFS